MVGIVSASVVSIVGVVSASMVSMVGIVSASVVNMVGVVSEANRSYRYSLHVYPLLPPLNTYRPL